jgi:hypothetical protein
VAPDANDSGGAGNIESRIRTGLGHFRVVVQFKFFLALPNEKGTVGHLGMSGEQVPRVGNPVLIADLEGRYRILGVDDARQTVRVHAASGPGAPIEDVPWSRLTFLDARQNAALMVKEVTQGHHASRWMVKDAMGDR